MSNGIEIRSLIEHSLLCYTGVHKQNWRPTLQELRFAIRMLLKQPGFSLIAALTLALGIGATSAIFSLIQGVLLTPPPYQNPGQLMLVPTVRTDGKDMERPRGWPAEQWMNWGNEAKLLQGIAGYDWTFNFLIHNDGSHSMQGMVVTRDFMHVMGLRPSAGRGFADADFQRGPQKQSCSAMSSGSASLAEISRSSARPCASAAGRLPPQ